MTIGEIIRDIRKEKGLTQSELADLAKTSVNTVRSYELDKITPWRNLQNIIEAMGYEIEIMRIETSANRASEKD